MVLEKGNDDEVSYYASQNPNCPPQSRIKWMMETGKIEQEDPNKHQIEYDTKPENKDEDLEKFKALLSKNFNLKQFKTAQSEEWYNGTTALNPNCSPDVLRMILEKGNDDGVSYYAARNPSCPPDLLRTILEKGKNDGVSEYAAENPNCPPDVLRTILEKGKNDGVSEYAALNPSCPPDVLRTILEKGKNDGVSQSASLNPNCPPQVKLKWMIETGQIEQEDPSKHQIEYNTKPENKDEDLEKFKELLN